MARVKHHVRLEYHFTLTADEARTLREMFQNPDHIMVVDPRLHAEIEKRMLGTRLPHHAKPLLNKIFHDLARPPEELYLHEDPDGEIFYDDIPF